MIDRFSTQQFEAALPRNKTTGEQMHEYVGFIDGERVYRFLIGNGAQVTVRSSIKGDGLAAEAGEDSIRIWLQDAVTGTPLAKKLQRYVTREYGWQDRMHEAIKKTWEKGLALRICPVCSRPMPLYQVKSETANKGRWFFNCHHYQTEFYQRQHRFEWADQAREERKPSITELDAATANEVMDEVAKFKTKKDSLLFLRDKLHTDSRFALFGLLKVFENQTTDEQAEGDTKWLNGVGFTGVDAEFLTSLAWQYKQRKSLSPKQLPFLFKKMPQYATQIYNDLKGGR